MKRIGTNKEPEYDEPEVFDEVWERVNGELKKLEDKVEGARSATKPEDSAEGAPQGCTLAPPSGEGEGEDR